jgi:hypothetical protein
MDESQSHSRILFTEKNEKAESEEGEAEALTMGRESISVNSHLPATEESSPSCFLSEKLTCSNEKPKKPIDSLIIFEEAEGQSLEEGPKREPGTEVNSPGMSAHHLNRNLSQKHHDITRSYSPTQKLRKVSDRFSSPRESQTTSEAHHLALKKVEEGILVTVDQATVSTFNQSRGQKSEGHPEEVSVLQ